MVVESEGKLNVEGKDLYIKSWLVSPLVVQPLGSQVEKLTRMP